MKINIPPEVVKYQIIILPVAVILVSAVLVYFVVIPQVSKIFESNTSLDDTKSKIEFLNNKATSLGTINIDEYQQNLNKLASALPYNNDIPNAITQVQILASDSKLQIGSLTFTGIGEAASSSDKFQINLEVAGEISSLKTFIENVKEAQRVMQITGLQLSGSNKSSVYQISITLLVYYQAQQGSVGPVDTPVELLDEEELKTLAKIVKNAPVASSGTSSIPTGERGKANPFE